LLQRSRHLPLAVAMHNSFHMNRLASILSPAQVLVSVDATSKKRAFEEAGLLFEGLHGMSRALITDSLFARERLGSTGLGHGVAIPHGRIKGLKAPMAAVFQLSRPIGFDAPDEQAVQLLIFLLVPEAATQQHLEILSEIAELLSDSDLRESLKSATDAQALYTLIANWQSASAS
jgi:nitrogen PTS system EIIA component